jgi:YbgC/YbaW family acyl-CoA thioester hydrolase
VSGGAFLHPHTVRFAEVDAAGISFFSRTFEACHVAFEACLEAGGWPLQDILAAGDVALPLVAAEARWRRPTRLGERLQVELRVEAVSERSVVFAYRVLDPAEEGDAAVRATARLTHAGLDRRTGRGAAVPARFLEALRRAGVLA